MSQPASSGQGMAAGGQGKGRKERGGGSGQRQRRIAQYRQERGEPPPVQDWSKAGQAAFKARQRESTKQHQGRMQTMAEDLSKKDSEIQELRGRMEKLENRLNSRSSRDPATDEEY